MTTNDVYLELLSLYAIRIGLERVQTMAVRTGQPLPDAVGSIAWNAGQRTKTLGLKWEQERARARFIARR